MSDLHDDVAMALVDSGCADYGPHVMHRLAEVAIARDREYLIEKVEALRTGADGGYADAVEAVLQILRGEP